MTTQRSTKFRKATAPAGFLIAAASVLLTAASASATIVSFKDGVSPSGTYAGTQDTMLISDSNANLDNFGSRLNFEVGRLSSGNRRSLLRFDVSSLTGLYTSINSITLRLTISTAPTTTGTAQLHIPVVANAGWLEGTGLGSGGTSGQTEADDVGVSTWNFLSTPAHPPGTGGTAWNGGAGLGTTGYGAMLTSTGWTTSNTVNSTFDLVISNSSDATNVINGWLDGTNEGLLVRAATETGTTANRIIFHSRDVASDSAAFRPELIVDYVPVPEPSSLVLALVGGVALCFRRRRGC